MNISILISALESIKRQEGDIDLAVETWCDSCGKYHDAGDVFVALVDEHVPVKISRRDQ